MLVREEADVAIARKWVRQLAADAGLSDPKTHSLATAVSEIARNIVVHARTGELSITLTRDSERCGLVLVARDTGPGIPDLQKAMQDGYSTAGRLGLGLSGAQRLVDEFEIESWVDQGTTVTLRMWAR
jgi:serine/threonine-protein kinase RsbT